MTFSYYYIDKQNQQQGPITADRFAEFGIRPDTLVWREGMRSWMAAISLNELQPLFRGENFNGQTTGYNSMSGGYNNGYQQPLPNYQVPPMPPRPIGHIVLTAISAFLCFGTIILLPFPIIGFIKCLEAEKNTTSAYTPRPLRLPKKPESGASSASGSSLRYFYSSLYSILF